MKKSILVVAAGLAVCTMADTLTWSSMSGGNWSEAANWSSDGSHAVPRNGDRVVIPLSAGAEAVNDLNGLSLSHLRMVFRRDGAQGTTGRKHIKFSGNPITLTGGLDALRTESVLAGSAHEGDYAIDCGIPFVLSDTEAAGTNKFDLTCRYTQLGALSGPGTLWFSCGGVANALKCVNTCAGGTYLTGSGIFDLEDAQGLGDGTVKAVHALTGGMVRQYVNCPAWLDIRPAATLADTTYTFGTYGNLAFDGPVTGTRFVLLGLSPNLTSTVNGDIDVDGPVHAARDASGANYSVVFNGRVRCRDFGRLYQTVAGNVTLNHADNDIANFYSLYQNAYAGAVNCFGTNAVVRFREASDAHGVMDLRGFDQRINRIVLDGDHVIAGEEGHLITSSTGPATLTMAATADAVCDAKFGGDLSLVWAPKGNATFMTFVDYGRRMPMTGSLVVSNGTFEVNGANAFPHAQALVVADGARFSWLSSVQEGLNGLATLSVGNGATFEMGAGAALPFTSKAYRAALVLDLASTAQMLLPDGTEFPVCGLSTNGVALPAGTVASGVAADGAVVLPQLGGRAVLIRVTGVPPTEKVALSARAYVQDGLVCLLDGIENAGYGVTDLTATLWKDLSGTAGDFDVDTGVGQFTGKALRKTITGSLARNGVRRTDVRTLEGAVSGSSAAGTGSVMPVFISPDQYLVWNDNGGTRYLNAGRNQARWATTACPADLTFAVVYESETRASGFYQNGERPAGADYAADGWSDCNNPPGGMTLGGRRISWDGGDTRPYGYEVNAVRMYSRVLTPAEIVNNWVVDTYRFHGTLPAETENYRLARDGSGVLECRISVRVGGGEVLINGAAVPEEGFWAELGETLTVAIRPDASHAFGSWEGDVDAVVDGDLTDDTVVVRVNRALTLGAGMSSALLVVSRDTNLTQDTACSGIRFLGAYTVTAADGVRLTVDENGSGIEVADGVTGTATVACPLEIAPQFGGSVQPVRIPAGAKLAVTGAFMGRAGLAFAGGGDFETSGVASDYAGNVEISNGVVSVSGRFLARDAVMKLHNRAQLYLDSGEVGGVVEAYQTNNFTWVEAKTGTDNHLRGGLVVKRSGTAEWSLQIGKDARLFVACNFNNSAGAYSNLRGSGELHLTNITYSATMAGAYQPQAGTTTHLWQAGALRVGNHLSARGALISHAPNTIDHSPLRLMNGASWDLGGYDQTCGRFSWMDADTDAEIRSTAPATLRVYQDKQSGSGSNRGAVMFCGRMKGRVSLVKTGNETATAASSQVAEDLLLGSSVESAGEVGVVWGLLSFTNGTDRVGSWPNCVRATAGGTQDASGNAHAGTLELLHSKVFGREVEVHVKDGGKVRLGPGVSQRVCELYLDGSETPAEHGFWGSTASGAAHADDVHFEGPGVLYVTGPNEPSTVMIFR